MGWLDRLESETETKAFVVVSEDGFMSLSGRLPVGLARYSRDVGEGLHSNVVMSPVGWIMRNFTEAEAIVQTRKNRLWEHSVDHPLELILARPNPYYGDDLLWKATVLSYCLDGNAYWQKVRNAFGDVLGFWYLPHFLVEPKYPLAPKVGDPFITHYEYRPNPGGGPIELKVRDVVHYRWGLDPTNPRLGLSPVKPLLREVFTDEEAADFSASILRNMGVPGGIISPKNTPITNKEEAKKLKDYMKNEFSGTRRGEWLAFGEPTEVQQFGFDPNSLMLGSLRDISEERVCAALGVPAAVVGFGSGLQQTKVGATMKELRKEAWDSCIRPMQNSMSKQATQQILPDFVQQLRRFRVRFDTSAFAASQEEENEKAARISLLYEKGLLRGDRAQEMLGLEVDPARAKYADEVKREAEPEVPPAVAGRLNGTGATPKATEN